jgi:purine-cytosine permease-like protein
LATWLTVLGVAFSPIIGVVLVNQYLLKNNSSSRNTYWPALLSWAVGCSVAFVPWGIPVLNAMAASALCFALIGKTRA